MKETYQKGSYQDYLNGNTAGKKFTFQLVRKKASTSLTNARTGAPIQFVGSYKIPNVSIISDRDPKSGIISQKVIRYIPGESSIYKDQQSPDKDVPKKSHQIEFINGRKTVLGTDVLLLDFMMKCNHNATNPMRKTEEQPRFELVDTLVQVSKEIAKDKLISEVTHWCWNGALDEVKAYARVLNVDINQSTDEIRHNLKVIAMRDPEKFMRDLKNPAMRKKHYVLEAVDRGFLTIDPASNSIAWTNNIHAPIAVAAVGTSPVDVLVQKLSTDEGALVYNAIIDLVTPDEVVVANLTVPSKAELQEMKQSKVVVVEPTSSVEESDSELTDIINEAITLGLVTEKPPIWKSYKGKNFKNFAGFIEAMKENPLILKNLRYEIEKAKKALQAQA